MAVLPLREVIQAERGRWELMVDSTIVRRALQLLVAGGVLVALDVRVRGVDLASDAVGLALACGGMVGFARQRGDLVYRRLVLAAQALLGTALVLAVVDEAGIQPSTPWTSILMHLLPLAALNVVCVAGTRLCIATRRFRAARSWQASFDAVATVLDIPAAVAVSLGAAGIWGWLPAGAAGTAVRLGAAVVALVPLVHLLLTAQVTATDEPERAIRTRQPVIDLRTPVEPELTPAPTPLLRGARVAGR